jgi:hypothetical protein
VKPQGGPIVTLTLFGFRGIWKLWAFAQMAFARPALMLLPGLRFWKLLGSGRDHGFSLRPDPSRYGLLTVWDELETAERFMSRSRLMRAYRRHASETWTVWLRPLRSHGAWDGADPFAWDDPSAGPRAGAKRAGGPIAVLTRATIRPAKARSFWTHVGPTSSSLATADGVLAATGLGEFQVLRQATFSLWRDEGSVKRFAYEQAAHRDVVARTRSERWYAEELFARFEPFASEGAWFGRDPLAGIL